MPSQKVGVLYLIKPTLRAECSKELLMHGLFNEMTIFASNHLDCIELS